MVRIIFITSLIFLGSSVVAQNAMVGQENGSLKLTQTGKPRNIVFILTDDHRYDALGFMNSQSFIKTPNLDLLAKNGAHLKNAFVTTSLCSPSRARSLLVCLRTNIRW